MTNVNYGQLLITDAMVHEIGIPPGSDDTKSIDVRCMTDAWVLAETCYRSIDLAPNPIGAPRAANDEVGSYFL